MAHVAAWPCPAIPSSGAATGWTRCRGPTRRSPHPSRRALPLSEAPGQVEAGNRPPVSTAYVAPSTPGQEIVAELWSELLGIRPIGALDNLFELGGHSLLATQFVVRLRARLGVALPLETVFATPTVAGIAATLPQTGPVPTTTVAPQPSVAPTIPRADRDAGPAPLSSGQHRLWFLDQAYQQSAYTVGTALLLDGTLDVDALRGALAELTRRHESLRTVFPLGPDGDPVQQVLPPGPVDLPIVSAPDRRGRHGPGRPQHRGAGGRRRGAAVGPRRPRRRRRTPVRPGPRAAVPGRAPAHRRRPARAVDDHAPRRLRRLVTRHRRRRGGHPVRRRPGRSRRTAARTGRPVRRLRPVATRPAGGHRQRRHAVLARATRRGGERPGGAHRPAPTTRADLPRRGAHPGPVRRARRRAAPVSARPGAPPWP